MNIQLKKQKNVICTIIIAVAEAESEPEDGLSDVEESCVDGNETEQRIELGKLNPEVDLMVNRLREVYASMGDELYIK